MYRYLILLVVKLIRTLIILCKKLVYHLIIIKHWNRRPFLIYLILASLSTFALVYHQADGKLDWPTVSEAIFDFDDDEVIQVRTKR